MSIDLIIFDCDGVIADSESISADILLRYLSELGLDLTLDDFRRDFLGRAFPVVIRNLHIRHGLVVPDNFETVYRQRLLDEFESSLYPTPGFMDMFRSLDRPCCVATSAGEARVARTLQLLELDTALDGRVFNASMVTNGKPAPDLFLLAARTMNFQPQSSLVIEDSPAGISAAIAAGMHLLVYRGGAHMHGLADPAPPGIVSFDNWDQFPQLLMRFEQNEGFR